MIKQKLYSSLFILSMAGAGGLLTSCTQNNQDSPGQTGVMNPKLAVIIVVDGLPQYQLLDFSDRMEGGLKKLKDNGAWFYQANYNYTNTYTAVGHTTLLTGANPYVHGVIGNQWYDRESGKTVYCYGDKDSHYLNLEGKKHLEGVSPKNMLVNTFGDQLILNSDRQSKVFGVSIKDRAAVATAGKLGIAYHFSKKTGRFTTTDYYMDKYTTWWSKFQYKKIQDKWFKKKWSPIKPKDQYSISPDKVRPQSIDYQGLGKKFPHLLEGNKDKPSRSYYSKLPWTPFGDNLLLEFVKALIKAEKLGQSKSGGTDLLTVSFSSHDYINHLFGPESAESQDHLFRFDQVLAEFLHFLDTEIGMENIILTFTADHGFPMTPEYCSEMGVPAGRVPTEGLTEKLNNHLQDKFGTGEYILKFIQPSIYLDYKLILKNKLSPEGVENEVAQYLRDNIAGIAYVYTRTQLSNGDLPDTAMAKRIANSWHPKRGGDLFIIQEPCWYFHPAPNKYASLHGSPYHYDTNVPLIMMGSDIKPGKYYQEVETIDIVPTLGYLLDIPVPMGSEGRVLYEILK